MSHVMIIGGGFAGLAAAVALAEKGVAVTLFERRPLLGGRAYSVKDSTTGDTLDNGQHLFMGCYHHTLKFLKTIGTDRLLQFQKKMCVDFADSQGKQYRLRCPPLPAPFHLLVGLLRLQTLSFKEKCSMIKMMRKVSKLQEREMETLDQITCHEWLTLSNQTEESIKNFWTPLILATINELPSLSSAKMLAIVLKEALLKNKQDSLMALSTVGLSDLYTGAAQKFVEGRGGKVFTKKGIAKICVQDSAIQKIVLEDGTEQVANFYISAIPPDALLSLIEPEVLQAHPFFEKFKEFKFSPILSINLWFDQPIFKETFAGFIDSPLHWIFNKGAILNGSKNYVSLVISAAYDLKDFNQEKLVTLALQEIHKSFPESKKIILKHSRVLKELRATPSFTVGSEKLRPSSQTPLQNLFLAGDWTATGLPATIEGAVKSGYEAAGKI